MNFAIKLNQEVHCFKTYQGALRAALLFNASLHRVHGWQGDSPVLSPAL